MASHHQGGADLLSRIALNDNKAGMEGLDRDKINKIILETSKGSKFYENELKKEQQVNQRIEKMMEQKARITKEQLKQAQAEVDKLTCELERSRELGRVIVHVDMDAFYAAVEMRDCPELKDKPMAVGSMSMLSTSNYHARRFGVRAAMPGFIAKKLCPNLVIVPTNFDKYRAVSAQVREIFSEYDPHFMPMSLDEAYLDITEHLEQRKHWPETMRTYHICDAKTGNDADRSAAESERDELSPVLFEDSPSSSPSLSGADGKAEVFGTSAEEAVREMRFRIEQKTSLTASAGIAPNMMLAKVCSDKNKPNGQYRIPPERQVVMEFMKDLPVRKVSGVGKVTEKMLAALGIVNCDQLSQQMALLSLLFSGTSWHNFLHISLGLGSTCIERDSERKSMSTERSIMGFLQKDGSDSGSFTQCAGSVLKAQEDSDGASFLKPQSTEMKVPSVSEQKSKSKGTQQQSFFQRAQLKRLQQQQREQMSVMAGTDTTNNSADAAAATQIDLSTTNNLSDTTSAKSLSNTNSGTDTTCYVNKPAVLKPSFKISTQVLQFLTCPVCNTEMKDVNLTAFNNHIDECLKGSAVDNEPTHLDVPKEQKELNSKPPASSSESRALKSSSHDPSCNEEKPSTSISVPLVETDEDGDFKTPFFSHRTKINGKRSVISKKKMPVCESSSKASLTTTHNLEAVTEMSSDSKGSSLTCPVCSQPQSTDDLTLFNRHVDMCLNQEVLLEFRESHPPVGHSDEPALKSVRGQLGDQGRVSKVREKSKRQGSSPLPPSKKIKVLSTKHTIDKFFKSNAGQKV
uniref:DNA polymerase kappa n=1 Tax=Cyprinus carpio carpio TaxID=630221 RepID=A0A9J8CUI7_CYPCA